MLFDSYQNVIWPFFFIALAASIPNGMWRWAGAILVRGIDEDSDALVFIRCLATSLVAAVVAQLVFFPNGALADVHIAVRLGSVVIGFIGFLLLGQRMIVGVLIAELCLLLGIVSF